MQNNPYAPPQAENPQLPMGAPQAPGAPMPWGIGEALEVGWNAIKSYFVPLVFGYLVAGIPGFILSLIAGQLEKQYMDPTDPTSLAYLSEPGYWATQIGFSIPTSLIAAFFQGGLVKIWLSAARGQSPEFGDLFTGGPFFLRIFGFNFITAMVIVFSGPLLLIPAAIFCSGTALTQFYIVDQNVGLMDGFKSSWDAARGHKLNMFLYFVCYVLLVCSGLLACGIGVVATGIVIPPLAFVGWAFIYLRLSGRASMAQGPMPGPYGAYNPMPGPGQMAPPPGGFGPPPGY